jgi:hypothetical protein
VRNIAAVEVAVPSTHFLSSFGLWLAEDEALTARSVMISIGSTSADLCNGCVGSLVSVLSAFDAGESLVANVHPLSDFHLATHD